MPKRKATVRINTRNPKRLRLGAQLGLNTAVSAIKAFRNRKKGSKTNTRRQKSIRSSARKQFDGVYKSFVKIKGKKMPKFSRNNITMKNRSCKGTNVTHSSTGLVGQQKIFVAFRMNARLDMNTEISSVDGYGIWHGSVVNQLWTNQSNAQIFICAYFWKCKRGTDIGPFTLWDNLVTNKVGGNIENDWFTRPTDFPEWSYYYTLEKVQEVCISPGAVWKVGASHFPNYHVKPPKVLIGTQQNYIANVTSGMFFTFHGPPLNDTVLTTQVSLGFDQRLVGCESKKFFFTEYTTNPQTMAFTANIPTAYTNNPNVMLEDADTIAVGTSA